MKRFLKAVQKYAAEETITDVNRHNLQTRSSFQPSVTNIFNKQPSQIPCKIIFSSNMASNRLAKVPLNRVRRSLEKKKLAHETKILPAIKTHEHAWLGLTKLTKTYFHKPQSVDLLSWRVVVFHSGPLSYNAASDPVTGTESCGAVGRCATLVQEIRRH